MTNEPKYFRPCSAIDPVINLGSLAYGDLVETPYAHEETIPENSEHSRSQGLENKAN